MAYCLAWQGQHRVALAHYTRAVEAGFAPAAVWNDLGFSHLQLGPRHLKEAQQCFDQAVALAPDLQAAHYNRAVTAFSIALQGSDPPDPAALDDIGKALQLGPATTDLYYDAARVFTLAARHNRRWIERALHCLRLAIEHGQDVESVQNDRVFCELRKEPAFLDVVRPIRSSSAATKAIRLVDPCPDPAS
jgi:tetratricopeptide (TPR) repeat protein